MSCAGASFKLSFCAIVQAFHSMMHLHSYEMRQHVKHPSSGSKKILESAFFLNSNRIEFVKIYFLQPDLKVSVNESFYSSKIHEQKEERSSKKCKSQLPRSEHSENLCICANE